jgi:NAD(P)-dependent dehydrogenase (short-subunit alcohol dehydrogenase family)
MKELRDRVAVVTGGASGVGRALAKAFLGEGMKVVLADVEEPVLETTAKELSALGQGVVTTHVTDVRRSESLEALADHTFSTFGACHLLCNNAGVSVAQLNVWETTPNDWEWVHGVNVRGLMHGVQAFVPRMIDEGEEGLVMNTSSGDGGIAPLAGQSVYAASKAAVSILTECLDAQLAAQTNLRAAIFYPSGGMLATGIWTTKRNRPNELAREVPVPEGSETTFEDFMTGMKAAGIDLPVQDLDELAQHALDGIKRGDFIIMIRREEMERQLIDRAKKLAAGMNPTGVIPGI